MNQFPWSAVFALALTACSLSEPPADLVVINGPEPESLDPAIITGQADLRIAHALFEGLTRFNARTAKAEPGLAESWDVSADGKTYTFHLRPEAAWSTGEPITANDVLYSWFRALDPLTGADYVGQFFDIEGAEDYALGRSSDRAGVGIRALDERTVEARLNRPTPFFLDLCATPIFSIVPRQSIERYGDRWLMARPLPVSGAYQLVRWRLNDKIRLAKNPLYWDAARTESDLVDLLPSTTPSTALNLYESGAADVIWDKELAPSSLLDVLKKRTDFHAFDYLGSYFLRFNVTRPPLDDARVRKALCLAIDRRRIVEKITRAGETPADFLVPPGVANYRSPPGLGHDPDRARRLLAEAGYPGGKGFPRLEYMFNSVQTHQKIAVELQAMWGDELGIRLDLRQLEWKVYLNAQSKLDYDISRSSWIGDYNDANTFLDLFTSDNGNNRTGWRNPEYDALISRANSTADPARRRELFQAAESILIREETPIAPLFIYVGIELYRPEEVSGIYSNLLAEHPLRTIRVRRKARAADETR